MTNKRTTVAERAGAVVVVIVGAVLFLTGIAAARPTTAVEAGAMVRGWLRAGSERLGTRLKGRPAKVETFEDEDGLTLYYVVYLEGGGFVIVAADDLAEPIIAFSTGDRFDPSAENPLGTLVRNDLPRRLAAARAAGKAAAGGRRRARDKMSMGPHAKARAKWSLFRDMAGSAAEAAEAETAAAASDVCVEPMIPTEWGQSWVCGDACYNYYTPNNYPCGCVATALAQVIRFHEYPAAPADPEAVFTVTVDGTEHDLSMRGGDGSGGPYDYGSMVFQPGCDTPEPQRQAIGALCFDAAVAAEMRFSPGVSASGFHNARSALLNAFGYSNALLATGWTNGTNASLDAGYPAMIGLSETGEPVSHAVLCDGYGYDAGTIYHHLNMGWSGTYDAWYNLPDVSRYDAVTACMYNILADGSGLILSGRVTDIFDGSPMEAVEISAVGGHAAYAVQTDANGVFAIGGLPPNIRFDVAAAKDGYTFTPARTAATGDPANSYGIKGNAWGVDFQGAAGLLPVMKISEEVFEFVWKPGQGEPEPQTFTIENAGFGTLNWQITHDCNWIEVTPTAGSSTGGQTEVTLAVTDLTPGWYACELAVSDANAINAPKSLWVELRAGGSVRQVPDSYETIGEALAEAVDGDVIVLSPGTYTGSGNRDLGFMGKAVTVRSIDPNDPGIVAATVVDCQGAPMEGHRGFSFVMGEGPDSVLSGITLTGAYVNSDGGAIRCEGSSPIISRCVFLNNTADDGAAVYCGSNSGAIIDNCTFIDNQSIGSGGGLWCYMSSPTITGCTFSGNTAYMGGGLAARSAAPIIKRSFFQSNSSRGNGAGFYGYQSETVISDCVFTGNKTLADGGAVYNYGPGAAIITNCTLVGNMAEGPAGGVYNFGEMLSELTNCILWANSDGFGSGVSAQIYDALVSSTVNYCCVQGTAVDLAGVGNISEEPLFVEIDGADGVFGNEDDNLRLLAGSPCLDSGDNSVLGSPVETDIDGNGRVADGVVDMGAFEGPNQGFLVSSDRIDVPEGGLAELTVRLADKPNGVVEASVERYSGDGDLDVAAPAQLVFRPSNWYRGIKITLAAGEDLDNFESSTIIHVTSEGLWTVGVRATEIENEPNPNILFVDAGAPGGPQRYGVDWQDAYGRLWEALDVAALHREVREIRVAQGTYRPSDATDDPLATFRLANGLRIRGGYAGFGRPDPGDRDIGAYKTVLSGELGDGNCLSVVTAVGTDATAILDGFTVTGGRGRLGCGMYNSRANPTVLNCTFEYNESTGGGGGMANYQYSSPRLVGCVFRGNSATSGGGMYNYYASSPELKDCTFTGNHAEKTGGGMYNYYASNPVLSGCVFTGNTAVQHGGGVYNDYTKSLSLFGCTFTSNSAERGGGMYNFYFSSPAVTECLFTGNTATAGGGAMYNSQANPVLAGCIFTANGAPEGGAVHNADCKAGLVIGNCTFSYNAAERGGAVYVYSYRRPELVNSILWADSAAEGPEIYLAYRNLTYPSGITVSYSDVEGGAEAVFIGQGCNLDWQAGNIDIAPAFVDQPQGDFHLRSAGWRWDRDRGVWTWDDLTSRCIDAGSPGWPPGGEPEAVEGDPGNVWAVNRRINMGAYGGTAEASMPPRGWALLADMDNSGRVDLTDLGLWTGYWLDAVGGWPGDLNRDGIQDFADYCLFAADWMESTSWF